MCVMPVYALMLSRPSALLVRIEKTMQGAVSRQVLIRTHAYADQADRQVSTDVCSGRRRVCCGTAELGTQ